MATDAQIADGAEGCKPVPIPAISPDFQSIAPRVPDGFVFKYENVIRGGRENHTWALIHEIGAIHVHGFLCARWPYGSGFEWIGGIETHWASAPDYMSADKPSHAHCWLLGKPCWHDGTSLGFSDGLAGWLPSEGRPLRENDHDEVFSVLVRWHRDQFPEAWKNA